MTFSFPSSRRLHGARAFAEVFDAKCRAPAGPLAVLARPNGLRFCRLGLSVGRRCGGAVQRQHLKRMLREAFRLTQGEHPLLAAAENGEGPGGGFDVVVVAHPHPPARLEDYRRWLLEGMAHGRKVWQKRMDKAGG